MLRNLNFQSSQARLSTPPLVCRHRKNRESLAEKHFSLFRCAPWCLRRPFVSRAGALRDKFHLTKSY